MAKDLYSEALDLIYESILTPDALSDLIGFILEEFGGEAGDIVTEAPKQRFIHTYGSLGFDPVYRALYDSDYLGQNPWVDSLAKLPGDRAHPVEDHDPALLDTAYYQDWAHPQGLLRSVGGLVSHSQTRHTWIGVAGRGWREDQAAKLSTFLTPLLPHLRRALSIGESTACTALRQEAAEAALDNLRVPVLLLDARGRIQMQNAAATRLIEGDAAFNVTLTGTLALRHMADDARLRAAIAAAVDPSKGETGPDATSVAFADRPGVVAHVMPLAPRNTEANARALLTFSAAGSLSPEAVRGVADAIDLTPTEADLAIALARGRTLKAFAEDRGMKIATARWHLKNVEQKTNTQRREQLVALLNDLASPFDVPPI